MSALEKLTEGIVARDLGKEGAALMTKWEKTGLLEGIDCDVKKNTMARLLENQAKELLREASTMAAGDVEGFSAVAFPLVRRVFGELIANDLVSVQPMSLPSGLIFFMDFLYNGTKLGNVATADESIYGGNRVGNQITGGLILSGAGDGAPEEGPYSLNNGYASPTGAATLVTTLLASGTYGGGIVASDNGDILAGDVLASTFDRYLRYDPDIVSGTNCAVATIPYSDLTDNNVNVDDLITIAPATALADGLTQRRLTRIDPDDTSRVYIVTVATGTEDLTSMATALDTNSWSAALNDVWQQGDAIGSVRGATAWALENTPNIPEIDIKVNSVAVTADTKKLKAKWTPELGQDLNAYHNLDAEVELTSILSEQIALEIDQEILNDLVQGAAKGAGVRYWSRDAGKFVNRTSGVEVGTDGTPDFTGTVSEWYETLIESINDISAVIHRKTIRGGANFIVCGP